MSKDLKVSEESEKKKYCVIVNAVVVRSGKILLCQRSFEEKHVPGGWSPPGGKLEETGTVWNALQKTVQREAFEEAGVRVRDRMHLLINNTFNHAEDDLQVISLVFLCRYKSGRARPLEDTVAVKWVSAAELDHYPFTHQNVKNYVIKAFEYLKSHSL